MKTWVLASALIPILVLAACGKKADEQNAPAGGTSIVPGATPAAVGSGVGALGEADNPACKVLTRADAEAWIGHPLEENSGRPMPVGFDCKYRTKQPFSSVSVILYTSNGADSMQKQKNAQLFGTAPVTIPGVGAEAVRSPDNNVVGVVVGDKLAYALLITGKPTAEAAEKVAKAIASHM